MRNAFIIDVLDNDIGSFQQCWFISAMATGVEVNFILFIRSNLLLLRKTQGQVLDTVCEMYGAHQNSRQRVKGWGGGGWFHLNSMNVNFFKCSFQFNG